jgi:hypothetical protein
VRSSARTHTPLQKLLRFEDSDLNPKPSLKANFWKKKLKKKGEPLNWASQGEINLRSGLKKFLP